MAISESTVSTNAAPPFLRISLSANLSELEQKVKSALDIQTYIHERALTALAVAFRGGILLSAILPSPRSRPRYAGSARNSQYGMRSATANSDAVSDTPKNGTGAFKDALLGVAVTKLRSFLGEVLPGFRNQFDSVKNQESGAGGVADNNPKARSAGA
jgi:hypothetical protein